MCLKNTECNKIISDTVSDIKNSIFRSIYKRIEVNSTNRRLEEEDQWNEAENEANRVMKITDTSSDEWFAEVDKFYLEVLPEQEIQAIADM